MKTVHALILIWLALICFPATTHAQEKDTQRKGLKIDDALFDNTTLNPSLFRSLLNDIFVETDLFEKTVFKAVEYAHHLNSKSAYHHEMVRAGERLSFQLSDGLFMIRILTKEEHEKITQIPLDDLPSDLKSKQLFVVTRVTNGCISVERGATKLAIPAARILYFQRGLAPFFR